MSFCSLLSTLYFREIFIKISRNSRKLCENLSKCFHENRLWCYIPQRKNKLGKEYECGMILPKVFTIFNREEIRRSTWWENVVESIYLLNYCKNKWKVHCYSFLTQFYSPYNQMNANYLTQDSRISVFQSWRLNDNELEV